MRSTRIRHLISAALCLGLAACGGGSSGSSPPAQPSISLSATSLTFDATVGGANPASKTVTVTNGAAGSLAAPTAAITYGSGAGWLTATVTGAAPPYTVTVQPTTGALPAGVHTATVSLASAGASNSPQNVAVTFTVSAAPPTPAIGLSSSALTFHASAGGANPASQAVTVSNTGTGSLTAPSVSIAYTSGSGWLSATVSGATAPYQVTVQPATGALPIGTYAATVSVSSPGAVNSPQSISVTFVVDQTWTVFVYGHADHNLSDSLIRDLSEMVAATLSASVNVIVAADLSAGRTAPDGTPYPTGTTWLRIPGGGADPVELGVLPEQNFDDPAVLQASIEAAFESFPADRYGLVLWDHGGSWAGGFGGDENDKPGDQAAYGGGMSAGQAASAIRAALDALGLTGTRPLEFLSFDTCLMAGNEVAYEMRGLSKVYLANAELDFGDGWDYASTFSWLSAHRAATAREFATAEIAAWDAHHAQAGTDDRQLRTHIGLDMSQYDAYTNAFAGLTSALLASATIDPFEVARAHYAATPGYGGDFASVTATPDLRDAGQLLNALGSVTSDANVASAAAAAASAGNAMDIGSSLGALRQSNGQVGFHMEWPVAGSWAARRDAYQVLPWNQATDWGLFLDAMAAVAATDAGAPTVTTSIVNASNPTTAAPPTLTIGSADSDVAEAQVWLGETVAGHVVMYGVIGSGFVEPGVQYQFTWEGRQVLLSDGTNTSYCVVLPWIGGASPVFLAPGQLTADGATVTAYAVLDTTATTVSTVFIVDEGRTAALDLANLGGAVFTPAVWDVTSGAYVADSALTIPASAGASLGIQVAQVTPGTYHLVTTMSDVWGNVGSARDDVTVVNPF